MYKKNNASSCKGNFCLQRICIPLKKLGHPPAYTRWVLLATRRNIQYKKKNQKKKYVQVQVLKFQPISIFFFYFFTGFFFCTESLNSPKTAMTCPLVLENIITIQDHSSCYDVLYPMKRSVPRTLVKLALIWWLGCWSRPNKQMQITYNARQYIACINMPNLPIKKT